MKKVGRIITIFAVMVLLVMTFSANAFAAGKEMSMQTPEKNRGSIGWLGSSWGEGSYFDDDDLPWGSGRFGSSWGDRSYFDDDDLPWGNGRFGSSWGDRSYFDDDDLPWGSGRFGSSWGDRSYFDDDDLPWGSGRPDADMLCFHDR